jgi:hypothetical protein
MDPTITPQEHGAAILDATSDSLRLAAATTSRPIATSSFHETV